MYQGAIEIIQRVRPNLLTDNRLTDPIPPPNKDGLIAQVIRFDSEGRLHDVSYRRLISDEEKEPQTP
ncbi:hypothetical protein A3K55_00575 [Candidatus Shapirobacteria bacterium RBG_13_44_7]|uniref:Uncharacterized protein n=1 Tax=Candidatus Shapirobacteria bacterium RBG_13_44_7 TaxID=1802149 RepID=A0A1F7SEU2_9BACT|nr:MAG: hypothetical protein A3K55_00575 [Candidatus Shapirobacteria bacterium RBG_13_44_7]